MKQIELSSTHWYYLAVVACLAIPVLILLATLPTSYPWFYNQIYGPELERELGFSVALVKVPTETECGFFKVLVIASVKKGGEFDAFGFRPGDVPVGFSHGAYAAFFPTLNYQRGKGPFVVKVIPFSAYQKQDWRKTREICVQLPEKN